MNFGVTDYTPSMWLGTTSCASTSWMTNTQMICITPINMGATVFVVDVDGNTKSVVSDTDMPFDISFDSPVPTYGSPLNGPVSTLHAALCTSVVAKDQGILSHKTPTVCHSNVNS